MLLYYDKNYKEEQFLFCMPLFVRLTFSFSHYIVIFNSEITSDIQKVVSEDVVANL